MSFVGSALLLFNACALEFADVFEAIFAMFVKKRSVSVRMRANAQKYNRK